MTNLTQVNFNFGKKRKEKKRISIYNYIPVDKFKFLKYIYIA